MTAAPTPRFDVAAERGVVGLALVTGGRVSDAILDRVAPADFYDERLREIMGAIAELRGDGHDPEPRAVAGQLRRRGVLDAVGGLGALDALTAAAATAGSIERLCLDIAEAAVDRRRLTATYGLQAAIGAEDRGEWDRAVSDLHNADGERHRRSWHTPDDVLERLYQSLDGSGDRTRWPWPLSRLNHLTAGGARRGQLTFIGGHTSHGKSALVDLCLQSMSAAGARSALFLNEQTVDERAERVAAELANVHYSRIQGQSAGTGAMTRDELSAVITAMKNQKVAFCPSHGWTAEQVIREARRRRLDVMAFDLVQKLPHVPGTPRLQVLEDAVQRFDAFAKDTGCHVILAGQTNRGRLQADGTFPIPSVGDIKDCAELGNGADNVLFVWREQDAETLDPLEDGVLRMAKYRGARLETIPARFEGEYQRWVERQLVHGVAA